MILWGFLGEVNSAPFLGVGSVHLPEKSKSLIQFSVDGWDCVPSLYWVGVMAVMAISLIKTFASIPWLPGM